MADTVTRKGHQPQSTGKSSIGGVYEICIGVPDLLEATRYWEQWGYRVGEVGHLTADAATMLYGMDSDVRSVRLLHGDADHGLLRLQSWQQPTGDGLGLASLGVLGSRWTATMVTDALAVLNHVEEAAAAGQPISAVDPQWARIYVPKGSQRPFVDAAIGVREMLVLQPYWRQVVFQRFGYVIKNYGTIQPAAPLQASQVTHVGLVVQTDDATCLSFYDDVLGLLRVTDDVENTYETSRAARPIFDLSPGDRYYVTDFDDPRSSATDVTAARSGRLKIIRFPEGRPRDDHTTDARPGALGVSCYVYQVSDIQAYHRRLTDSAATDVSDVCANEFDERSCTFTAPDGYVWILVEPAV